MSWPELVARPELWPANCKVSKAYSYPEDVLSPEQTYPVVHVGAEDLEIVLPSGRTGLVPHVDTDALAVANAAFAAMSPAQRALDLETLVQRADLWPSTIRLRKRVAFGAHDAENAYANGSELSFGTFDGTWIKAKLSAGDAPPVLSVHATDFVERVRAAFVEKPRSTGHRVLQELDGKLIDLRTGRKARVNAKRPPDYVVLYFSAGWCGPCHEFSPLLVSFYEKNKRLAGKRFEIVWISRDRSETEMKEYAAEFGFPWLAVSWDRLGQIPITQAHDVAGIPDLVVLDANGALVADSYVGEKYRGARSVLELLTERVQKRK